MYVPIRKATNWPITVAIAAPLTPRAGNPSFPLISIQLNRIFRTFATKLYSSGALVFPIALSAAVYVVVRASGIKPTRIILRYSDA